MTSQSTDLLSMSVFTALKRARTKRNEFPNFTFLDSAELCMQTSSDGTPHDYDRAEELDKFLPSDIVNLDDPEVIRRALDLIISKYSYSWGYLFPSGREAVRNALTRNEFQVFRNADLFQEVPSIDIISWWDRIANSFRVNAIDNSYRDAELKTFELERAYLREAQCPHEPSWVALNDNSLGFDIRSYRFHHDQWVPFPIEVKSTTGNKIRFYLTRNEADLAIRMKKLYALHFWMPTATSPLVFTSDEIGLNLPRENGKGNWQTLIIDYGPESEFMRN